MRYFTLFLIVITFIGCQRNNKLTIAERLNSNSQIINLKHFGVMNCSDDPTTRLIKFVTINEQKFDLELNYPVHVNKKSLFLQNESTLEELENVMQKSRKELNSQFKNKGLTQAFIKEHLEEFEKEDFEFHKIDPQQNTSTKELVLLNAIELRRIGIFLVDYKKHIILTYHIPEKGYKFANELLVTFNKKYDLTEMTIKR